MPEHPAGLALQCLLGECRVTRTRRGGPGGQHRNRVATAVVIEHLPTGVRAEANERRSQEMNRRVALTRLRVSLAIEVRLPIDGSVIPSELWRQRVSGGKIIISTTHADFPPLLAEAIDHLAFREYDFPETAVYLGCSSTQLVKFLARSPAALVRVNQEREARGLSRLR